MATTTKKRTRKIEVNAAELAQIEAAGIPSFTLEADSAFGIQCMIAVRDVARRMLPREDVKAIEAKLREFDLYEEANR